LLCPGWAMRPIHQIANQTKYAVSASELCALAPRCPGFQREAVDDHVDAIVAYQMRSLRTRGSVSFAGCIVLCLCEGEMLCIDGQHRLLAVAKLLASGVLDFELVVEVFACKDASEVRDLFRIVNSNRPVPRFLLDETESLALTLKDHIRAAYPAFVSPSARPNVPNVNLDSFVQAVVDRFGATIAPGAGAAWIDARNEEHRLALATLGQRYERVAAGVEAIERDYKSASKSKGRRFYLGCYWLERPRNAALSKPLRAIVWRAWYATVAHDPNGDAACPCCESARICALTFHLGHKKSFARGGTDEQTNLIPLCAMCNTSMGTRDFTEYRESIHHGPGA